MGWENNPSHWDHPTSACVCLSVGLCVTSMQDTCWEQRCCKWGTTDNVWQRVPLHVSFEDTQNTQACTHSHKRQDTGIWNITQKSTCEHATHTYTWIGQIMCTHTDILINKQHWSDKNKERFLLKEYTAPGFNFKLKKKEGSVPLDTSLMLSWLQNKSHQSAFPPCYLKMWIKSQPPPKRKKWLYWLFVCVLWLHSCIVISSEPSSFHTAPVAFLLSSPESSA